MRDFVGWIDPQFASLFVVVVHRTGWQLRQGDLVELDDLRHELGVILGGSAMLRLEQIQSMGNLNLQCSQLLDMLECTDGPRNDLAEVGVVL